MSGQQIAIAARRKHLARVMAGAIGLRSGAEYCNWLAGTDRCDQLTHDRREHDQAHGKRAKPCAESSTGVKGHVEANVFSGRILALVL